ncbi:DNA polymerase III subunit delta [Populibacterium corticicola]|uniref:DNA-directed DNA polymerase n=1 Tax=Populibacterium corticicola TaxID=1812826 RepID=A0ABW5XBP1_9MICO
MATASRSSGSRSSAARSVTWEQAPLAPVVLIQGPEGLLVDRAIEVVTAGAREADPQVERTVLAGAGYQNGTLLLHTSPSLFGEARLIVIDNAEAATDALITDVVSYVGHPPAPDVWLVIAHRGGVRGKKMLDAIKASGAPVVACEALKKDGDKVSFAAQEFKRAGRRATAGAVRALVEALGSDVRELASACQQLIGDVSGTIDESMVEKYYGGRVEATGFKVADAAIAGQTAHAISLLRHALATGADPVPIVAALALKVRTLAKAGALRSGRTAADLGMAPWQADRARKELANWTPDGIARAIQAVAQADAEVKGQGRDPVFAVERAVLVICQSYGR